MTIVDDRLAQLDHLHLGHGPHPDFDHGTCVMEAVAWIAGEPHTDHPACASKVVTEFLINWNDGLRTDEERDRLLKPLIPLVVGTRTTEADEKVRAWMAADWLVREQVPAWLRLAGLTDHAHALESLAGLTGREQAVAAMPALRSARDAARDAAWDAARDVAGDAALAAAWAAARDAALAAARDAALAAALAAARDAAWAAAGAATGAAAWAAARAAAWAAARDAAGDAAGDAARDALEPTVTFLQTSATHLVKRMCEVGR